jgi:hypothetical protein
MCALACAYVSAAVLSSAQQPVAKTVPRTATASSAGAKLFGSGSEGRGLNNCRLKSRQVGLATESRLKEAALPRACDR